MVKKKLISVVIICHNEEENINDCYNELKKISKCLNKYKFDFIYVDNGSKDKTRQKIKNLCKKDKSVKGVILSRDFGPQASIEAGLEYVKGDAVVPFEGDLQDPPELIMDFVQKWEQGYDTVVAIRNKIEDGWIITQMRKLFYRVFRYMADIDIPINAGLYCLMDRKVINALNQIPEKYRFIRGLRSWVGFKTTYIEYARRKRKKGKSSYNFFKYIKTAERGIFGFGYLPLDIIVYLGFLLVIISFLFIVVYLLLFLFFGNPIKGSVTILVSIVFFGGIQLSAISIIGKYIQVITEESKSRPIFIVEELLGMSK